MTETLDSSALARRVSQLPPLPQAVVALMQALREETVSVNRCIALIESDAALAARTLRLANSAFYGVQGRVGSIGAAVRMLGLRTVSSALTAAALQAAVHFDDCPGFDFERHNRQALATALAARELGLHAGQDADEAFLAGLLQDVGQLVLASLAPLQAGRALAWAQAHGVSAVAAESAVLGLAHPQVGAMVAERWQFPPSLVRAIGRHHEPEAPPAGQRLSLSGLLQAADVIALALGAEDPSGAAQTGSVPASLNALWPTLGLKPEQAHRLCAHVQQGTLEFAAIFKAAPKAAAKAA
jgi:HD-like signal output (HDOD) protein